jgi:hypothetical protein
MLDEELVQALVGGEYAEGGVSVGSGSTCGHGSR